MNLAKRRAASLLVGMVLACAAMSTHVSMAQSTVFAYQGQLKEGGAPANGLYDFRFRLFDAASGGAQVGQTLCVNNVDVVNGLFTLPLDFGQQYATTAQRQLEVEVRVDAGLNCTNAGGFVVLSPRQQLTAAPLASHAKSAFVLDAADGSPANAVFVDNDGKVGIGTTSPQQLFHVNGSVGWGGTTTDFARSDEDASGLFLEQKGSSSAKSKIRLQTSKAGDVSNYSQFFVDPHNGFSFMTLGTGNGNVGIGTVSPATKLDVRGDIKLGTAGQYFATAGEENLRIVRGIVGPDGALLAGAGFTVSRQTTGFYSITFVPAFSETPSFTASPEVNTRRNINITSANGSQVQIQTYFTDGGAEDIKFHFIAIGPR